MKKILHGTALLFTMFVLPLTTRASVTISEAHTNVNCNGQNTGSIDITPSGGTAPYTFNWNGGQTTEDRANLVTGNYWVTATDFVGASASLLIYISEPATMTTLKSITTVYCGGGNTGAVDLTVLLEAPVILMYGTMVRLPKTLPVLRLLFIM